MLLNGILFNSEVWYNIRDEDIEKLKQVDEYLLRSVIGAPAKTPKETLYLESGCIPIEYIIKSRRLMYLHHILRRPNEELIKKFYEAQKLKPSKNDWVKTVDKDKEDLNINLDDEQIKQMSKYKFRKLMQASIREKAFEHLMNLKETHSKAEDLSYKKLETQSYLKSDNDLKNEEKEVLFKFRTRMADLKMNFKNMHIDHTCPLCKEHDDSQKHILECETILNKSEDLANNSRVEYEDIFEGKSKQIEAIKLISKAFKVREKLLEENQ